jgi:hypothetical protein
MSDDLARLRNSRGSDEANIDGVSYPRHSDGFFYVPEAIAQRLVGGGTGFYRPSPDEHPPAGSVSLAEAVDIVLALDPGPIRDALVATLSTAGAL